MYQSKINWFLNCGVKVKVIAVICFSELLQWGWGMHIKAWASTLVIYTMSANLVPY